MNKKSIIIKIIFLVVLLLLVGFIIYGNNHIVTNTIIFKNDKITEELNGYKILQLSDLHAVSFGVDNKRLIAKVDKVNPDIIVITGDIIDSKFSNKKVATKLVKNLADKYPVYYINGNHEYLLETNDLNEFYVSLEEAGAKIINNEYVEIPVGDDSFILYGLDDNNLHDQTLEKMMEENDKDKLSVVLAHEPQWFNKYVALDVDLVLSGHTHGGQIRVPFIGAIVAPDQGFFPKISDGVYESKDTVMVVSRGLGYTVVPVRLFNDPEIIVIEMNK